MRIATAADAAALLELNSQGIGSEGVHRDSLLVDSSYVDEVAMAKLLP